MAPAVGELQVSDYRYQLPTRLYAKSKIRYPRFLFGFKPLEPSGGGVINGGVLFHLNKLILGVLGGSIPGRGGGDAKCKKTKRTHSNRVFDPGRPDFSGLPPKNEPVTSPGQSAPSRYDPSAGSFAVAGL
jgi:hypothetical protein